ncbi:hypothetical protein SLA2020_303190 [Shorea laevis]
MLGATAVSTPVWLSAPAPSRTCNSFPRFCFLRRIPKSSSVILPNPEFFSLFHIPSPFFSLQRRYNTDPALSKCFFFVLRKMFDVQSNVTLEGENDDSWVDVEKLDTKSVLTFGTAEYIEEPTTNVKFQRSLSLPGCSGSLSLLGTGYREKVFAIIGVKVYAAGLYVNLSILSQLNAWKGQSTAEIQESPSLFNSILILLVRNHYRLFCIFQGRPLKKGTSIFLSWLNPSKMLVCVSSNDLPSSVDAEIESGNVTLALFDVFFGNAPVSPSLKDSVSKGLATILK